MGNLTTRKILVVDDSEDLADSLAMLLDFEGYEVKTAYNGKVALSLAETFAPDLVVLDINMPEHDGFYVARKLRAEHPDRETILLAMSALPVAIAGTEAVAAGCNGYVQKPAEFADLYEVIERYLGPP